MKFLRQCSWITDSDEECGEQCEGKMPYCASHSRQLRKEIETTLRETQKRASKLQKAKEKNRQKISRVSAKRKEINEEYFKLVEQFKRDNPYCKAKVNEYCTEKTDEPHHKKGRGAYLLDVETWLPTCRSCHAYIEAHPKEAKEKGWSESRLAKQPEKI